MFNTTVTNKDLQPQPLHGIPMNSYPEQMPPHVVSAWQISALDTVGPSELLPRQSNPYVDHPVFPTGQSGAAPGPPCDAPIVANTTE
jgi:hypothetical protein